MINSIDITLAIYFVYVLVSILSLLKKYLACSGYTFCLCVCITIFLSITNTVALKSLYCSSLYIYIIMAVMKFDIIASIQQRVDRKSCDIFVLVIIFVMTFKTDAIIFIGNVMMCFTSH